MVLQFFLSLVEIVGPIMRLGKVRMERVLEEMSYVSPFFAFSSLICFLISMILESKILQISFLCVSKLWAVFFCTFSIVFMILSYSVKISFAHLGFNSSKYFFLLSAAAIASKLSPSLSPPPATLSEELRLPWGEMEERERKPKGSEDFLAISRLIDSIVYRYSCSRFM